MKTFKQILQEEIGKEAKERLVLVRGKWYAHGGPAYDQDDGKTFLGYDEDGKEQTLNVRDIEQEKEVPKTPENKRP